MGYHYTMTEKKIRMKIAEWVARSGASPHDAFDMCEALLKFITYSSRDTPER